MKILHTADLHLGSPLRTASAEVKQAADTVLTRIVDTALSEQVDVLVIAGDIFDNGVPDLTLRARLVAQLSRAVRDGIPVVMIRGNHDALIDYDRFGPLGEGLHLLTRDTPSVTIGEAVFHGLSYTERHTGKSMLPDYPAPVAGRINVGLMHTSLGGAPGHDPYAPVAPGDLLAHGYDYWALGHIHQRSETVSSGVALVMPGIPQGRHAGEPGRGSVTLATLGGTPSLRAIPVAEVMFQTVDLDLSGIDQAAMIDLFAAQAPDGSPHRMLRFNLSGSSLPVATLEAFAEEALAGAAHAALEAIRVVQRAALAEADTLIALAADEARSDSLRDEAARLLTELRAALPPQARDALPETVEEALIDDALAELATAFGERHR